MTTVTPRDMTDPATRADYYLAAAVRNVKAARESIEQIEDPYEQDRARVEVMRFTSVVLDAALPPEAA